MQMLRSLFKPVPAWDMDRAKQYVEQHTLQDYNLIDVRQPEEFAEGHLPGATLIPLGEVERRLQEIDDARPTLVYCRSGGRAGNAVATMTQAGLKQVYNVGGIQQWNGLVATGAPEAGMAVFDPARTPLDHVALAWHLELQAEQFYQQLAGLYPDQQGFFGPMARGEAQHAEMLQRLWDELGGSGSPVVEGAGESDIMEGGLSRSEALQWVEQRELVDALELTATMEANAHDRYIRIGRRLEPPTQRIFVELAEAEKAHLEQLMRAFQQRLG